MSCEDPLRSDTDCKLAEGLGLYLSAGFEVFGDALVAAEDSTVKVGVLSPARLRWRSG